MLYFWVPEDKMKEKIFKTLKEVKETYLPNTPIKQLEGDMSAEELIKELKKVVKKKKK